MPRNLRSPHPYAVDKGQNLVTVGPPPGPPNASPGDVWFNTQDNTFYIYTSDGSWKAASNKLLDPSAVDGVTAGPTGPTGMGSDRCTFDNLASEGASLSSMMKSRRFMHCRSAK